MKFPNEASLPHSLWIYIYVCVCVNIKITQCSSTIKSSGRDIIVLIHTHTMCIHTHVARTHNRYYCDGIFYFQAYTNFPTSLAHDAGNHRFVCRAHTLTTHNIQSGQISCKKQYLTFLQKHSHTHTLTNCTASVVHAYRQGHKMNYPQSRGFVLYI